MRPAAVASEFTEQERAAIARIQGENSLVALLARVTAEVRGYVRSGNYTLDPAPRTLPLSLHGAAVALVRWRMITSVPTLKPFATKPRETAAKEAGDLLEKVAASKWAPEPPALPDAPPPLATEAGCWGSDNLVLPRTFPGTRPGTQFDPASLGSSNPNAPTTF